METSRKQRDCECVRKHRTDFGLHAGSHIIETRAGNQKTCVIPPSRLKSTLKAGPNVALRGPRGRPGRGAAARGPHGLLLAAAPQRHACGDGLRARARPNPEPFRVPLCAALALLTPCGQFRVTLSPRQRALKSRLSATGGGKRPAFSQANGLPCGGGGVRHHPVAGGAVARGFLELEVAQRRKRSIEKHHFVFARSTL